MHREERLNLYAKFRDFYFQKATNIITEHNRTRKSMLMIKICFIVFLVSFCMFPVCQIQLSIIQNVKLPLIIPIILINLITISLAFWHSKNLKTRNNTITIYSNGDAEIKKKLMPEFVNLFGKFKWTNDNCGAYSNYSTQQLILKKLIELKILNMAWFLTFDDCIEGTYNGIKLKISEINTHFQLQHLMGFLILGLFGGGCIFVILLILFIFVIIATYTILHEFISNDFITFILSILIPTISLISYVKKQNFLFRGCFIEIDMNKIFEGHTFVLEKSELARCIKIDKSKYQKVILEDSEILKDYDIYSDNQIEARYLLTTAFIERFKKLKNTFKAKFVRVAFKDNKITIAVNVEKDMFKMGSLTKDTTPEVFMELYEDMVEIIEMIDVLKLNQKLGL